MTGAQEEAILRLKKKHPTLTTEYPTPGATDEDIAVEWILKPDYVVRMNTKIVRGVITPQGRFVPEG